MGLRVLIAPDSYKGSASAIEIARAIAEGLSRAWVDAFLDLVPMSDGGDGFLEAIVFASGGRFEEVEVRGPLGKPVAARYGVLRDGTAVIEMAQASGLRLLRSDELNPLRASTYGTGELIKVALERGARKILIGVGGSATNDGGAGMAEALGVTFFDEQGKRLSGNPEDLSRLARVDSSGIHPAIRSGNVDVTVACDVETVLCGELGASRVFGPQKGASPDLVERLDKILDRYADIVEKGIGKKLRDVPGSGAAGGLAFGLMAFLNAKLKAGFDTVSAAVGLEAKLEKSDLVFTGEGRTDRQTKYGKTVSGIVRTAASKGVPVVVISGSLDQTQCDELMQDALVAVTSIAPGPITLEESMTCAATMVRDAAYRAARMIDIGFALASRRATE